MYVVSDSHWYSVSFSLSCIVVDMPTVRLLPRGQSVVDVNEIIFEMTLCQVERETQLSSVCSSISFLPRCGQRAVLLQQVVCHPSVGDVEVSWSHRLEYFKNNFMDFMAD